MAEEQEKKTGGRAKRIFSGFLRYEKYLLLLVAIVALVVILYNILQTRDQWTFLNIIKAALGNAGRWIKNIALTCVWAIIKFVLGIMEAFEFIINNFLGVDQGPDDYINFAKTYGFYDTLYKVFRTMAALSVVLILIFTIIAICRQEWATATSGMTKDNSKKDILMGILKKVITIATLPMLMYVSIGAVNAVLTSFSEALNGGVNATIAGQVLSSTTYDANKYRTYATSGKRIPIIIETYNTNDYGEDQKSVLKSKIMSSEVQTKLENIANTFSTSDWLTFNESLIYKNNKLTNSSAYGDSYESFVCTPEQYLVMADFIDYAEKTGLNFYIKSIDDPNIDWGYVEDVVFDKENYELSIDYVDSSDLSGNGSYSDTYNITYGTSYELTSPISDTLRTIEALLGVEDYGDTLFKTMERDEDSVNLVSWETEKTLIQLSSTFDIANPAGWTAVDELIVYEYYRFSSNNTFQKYSIDDLKNGVELETSQIVYRDYYSQADAYSPEKTINCVYINGNYYYVELSDTLTDSYGNHYYVLSSKTEKFLDSGYMTLEKSASTATLKFSTGFDINEPFADNGNYNWTYSDQILIYEYYSDFSSNNTLYAYTIDNFVSGVSVPMYTLSTYASVGASSAITTVNYIYINGTYYQAEGSTLANVSGDNFLYKFDSLTSTTKIYYAYKMNDSSANYNASDYIVTPGADDVFLSFSDCNATVVNSNSAYVGFEMAFSSKFSEKDISTWTYRDYLYFCIYNNYFTNTNEVNLTSFKLGVEGTAGLLGKTTNDQNSPISDAKKVFKISFNDIVSGVVTSKELYFDIEKIYGVSEELITNSPNESTLSENIGENVIITGSDLNVSNIWKYNTYSYEFSHSASYQSSNLSTWTVEDAILNIVKDKELISNESDTSIYYSLVYCIGGKNYYRLGSSDNVATLYLDENTIVSDYGQSFENWLNLNFCDFVCSLFDSNIDNIIFNESNLVDEVYEYYKKDSILTLNSYLESLLQKEILKMDSEKLKINEDIGIYTYTRSDTYNEGNISTWNYFDLLNYYLNGSTSNTSGNLIFYNGKIYYVLGDYAVNVSDGKFKSSISENNTISSQIASGDYDTYSNLVVDDSDFSKDEVAKVLSTKFKYVKTAGSDDTILDVILKKFNYQTFTDFDIYYSAGSYYIELKATDHDTKYVKVEKTLGSQICFNIGGIITLESNTNPISLSEGSPYKAFDTTKNYSKLDALIYFYTGRIVKNSNYQVYSINSKDYISLSVDGEYYFIETTDIDSEASVSIDSTLEKRIYDSFYANLVEFQASNLQENEKVEAKYTVLDENSNSPLSLILRQNGFYTGDVVNGYVYYVTKTSKMIFAPSSKGIFVDVTDICSYSTARKELSDESDLKEILKINTILADMNASNEDYSSLFSRNYLTVNASFAGVFNGVNYYSFDDAIKTEEEINYSTYNEAKWIDLIAYKLKSDLSGKYFVYTNVAGKKYVSIQIGEKEYYISIDGSAKNKIFDSGTSETIPEYDLNSALSVIKYKITNDRSSISVKKYNIFDDSIYYLNGYIIKNLDLNAGFSFEEIKNGSDPILITIGGTASGSDWTIISMILDLKLGSVRAETGYTSGVYKVTKKKIGTTSVAEEYFCFETSGEKCYLNLSALNLKVSTSLTGIESKDTSKFSGCSSILSVLKLINKNSISSGVSSLNTSGVEPVAETLAFSTNFKLDDYSTWTVGDYLIYYAVKNDCCGGKSLQEVASAGGLTVYNSKYIEKDYGYGSCKISDVYLFGNDSSNPKFIIKKSDIEDFVNKALVLNESNLTTNTINIGGSDVQTLTMTVSLSAPADTSSYTLLYVKENKINSSDFTYKNYYYYKLDTTKNENLKENVTKYSVKNLTQEGSINLKLSSGFEINDTSTWTILDYLVMKEYSNASEETNMLNGFSLSDLKTMDNYVPVYGVVEESVNYRIIYLNGNIYAIKENTGITVDKDGDGNVTGYSVTAKIGTDYISNVGLSGLSNYNLKILIETNEFVKNTSTSNILKLESKDRFSYTYNNVKYFRTVNEGNKVGYQIDLSRLAKYTISAIVREVNWPQKLMEDMKVIYPDLNWETLIATDGWFETLGDYTSSDSLGQFISENNSTNITAAGMVLSEFFLSVAKESEMGYATYEYETIFDENTIKSLMLSMLGENEYTNLKQQADVFMNFFNTSFASILEDIANSRGINIVDGQVDNLVMSVYKSYLTTILMGSDFSEYLYKVATRVYAQYTIYEALATASGDYASYVAYNNGDVDENGNSVTSFMYSTFYELVKYENEDAGANVPTFTFNYANVYKALCNGSAGDDEIQASFNLYDKTGAATAFVKALRDAGVTVSSEIENTIVKVITNCSKVGQSMVELIFEALELIHCDIDDAKREEVISNFGRYTFQDTLDALDDYYKNIYLVQNSSISDDDPCYCFMLDTYWSIRQELNKKNSKTEPVYLSLYHDYILGDINRWSSVKDSSIDAASLKIKKYEKNELLLVAAKSSFILKFSKMYALDSDSSAVDFDDVDSIGSFIDEMNEKINTDNINLNILLDSLGGEYKSALNRLKDNYKTCAKTFLSSENGDVDAWNTILQMEKDLTNVLNETKNLISMDDGEINENGTVKSKSTETYESIYTILVEAKDALSDYVDVQNELDAATKASISYTLSQYAKNYVADGFSINVENRDYVMNVSFSTQRLAEYVYGGKFLTKIGILPTYTDSDFEGIIRKVNIYDSTTKMVKSQLVGWDDLREFASSLANYTAKLYYLTNLNDLANNVNDDLILSSIVKYNGADVTLEQMIINYIIDLDDRLSTETLKRLICADSVSHLTLTGVSETSKMYSLVSSIEGNNAVDLSDDEVKEALKEYVAYVFSDDYCSSADGAQVVGYYDVSGTTGAKRIHLIFKNIMTYLLVSEDSEEVSLSTSINLDNLTFKDFRLLLFNGLIEYKNNSGETDEENSKRYLTIYDLICTQFEYSAGSTEIGRCIGENKIINNNTSYCAMYKGETNENISVTYTGNKSTSNFILKLCGLENRPIEELVNLEYDSLYDLHGNYDEENGDTFVCCFYDSTNGNFIPYLVTNSGYSASSNYGNYKNNYGKYVFNSKYCASNNAYPVVAKGVIDGDGKPTAIRIVDNEVCFYRDSVSATVEIDDDAIDRTSYASEVNTIGYTKQVESTYVTGDGSKTVKDSAMYLADSNMSLLLKSDLDYMFIQAQTVYGVDKADDLDAINVLDSFNTFYSLKIMDYMLICLAFIIMIPILFKASFQIMARVLNLILLMLAGPVAISTSQISPDGKTSKAMSTWQNYLTEELLCVFGYVVGFNIYYILIDTITNTTFLSQELYSKIMNSGGINLSAIKVFSVFGITYSKVEYLIRIVFIFVATGAIEGFANLLTSTVTSGIVGNAYSTTMSGQVTKSIKEMLDSIKKTFTKTRDIINGKALLQMKDAAIEGAKRMIPGGEIMSHAVDRAKRIKTYSKSKAMEKVAAQYMPRAAAKKLAKQYRDNENKVRDEKRNKRVKNANAFLSTYTESSVQFDSTYTLGRPKPSEKKKTGKPSKAAIKKVEKKKEKLK